MLCQGSIGEYNYGDLKNRMYNYSNKGLKMGVLYCDELAGKML